ncbi:MAG TPA: ATPase [Bacteroidales bacterium]|nr:ATPase [Bacteroidales bacterium]
MSKIIKLTRDFDATPEEVYYALTNPFTISLWTGEEAEMSTDPNSEFSIMGGDIQGRNLQFEPNKLIQQEWYFEGEQEKSIVTIRLEPHKAGTRMFVEQTGVPEDAYENLLEGWKEAYLSSLKLFFED